MKYIFTFKLFLRSKTVIVALVLYFIIGLLSIFIGKQFLQKHTKAIASVTNFQKEHIERNTTYVKDEFGLLLYYLKFAYINKPEPIAALAIGQQDVNASIQQVTIRGIEAQRYDTDLYNPTTLLVGNFDLSFVIIFLFPLLIIVFCFNVLSQEKEDGTWPLVKVQLKNALHFLWYKLSVRLLTVLFLLLLLLIAAKIIIGISLSASFLIYSLLAIAYIFVWFAICFFIISVQKNSSSNALLLLSIWLLLCLLLPAVFNNYINQKYPVKEAYNTLIKQRDGYHTKWDKNKDTTLIAFFNHYPQYKNYVWAKPTFNYLWYYAMQQLGDDEALNDSKAMHQKLLQRQQASENISLFFPTLHTQLQVTNIANTNLNTHLQFLDSTTAFHENLRHYFYPKIFGDSAIAKEDWSKHKVAFFKQNKSLNWLNSLLPLLSMVVFFIVFGAINLKNNFFKSKSY
jgi:ABC-2 type transport system permease protein